MRKKAKPKTFAEKAYRYTRIEAGITQQRMENMLAEIGITDVRITKIGEDYTVEFLVKLQHDENSRKVRMNVPIGSELGEDFRKQNRRKDAIFRVLYWHLKDRFVAVQNGLKEFESAFLDDLVVVSNGREIRLGDLIIPQYKEALKSSEMAVLNLKSN